MKGGVIKIMAKNAEPIGFAWFLVGFATGAAMALLYAPQSGRKTRQMISRKAQEGKDLIEETGSDLYEKGSDLYEKGREIADEAADIFERGRKLARG
jgi:gas vesicle protein